MRRKFITLVLIVLLCLSLSGTAYSLTIDPDRFCSFTVTLAAQGEPVVGAEFNIYYVAESTPHADNSLTYEYTESFADCGIALDDPDLAEKLSAYAETYDLPTEVLTTDENGQIGYEYLPFGMYLLRQTGAVDGYSTCAPFLMTLPMVTETEILYDVDASPKTDVCRMADITIEKLWVADKDTKDFPAVSVQLLRGDEVVETAVLDAGNGWKITYEDLPAGDTYSVKEPNPPKGYTPTYKQDGYAFTVINSSTLAQTGQTIWPIPVLELELPVLSDWSYEKLREAPCQYYGTCHEPDFVIAAHNYPGHYGRLNELRSGDVILFTDLTGAVCTYEVVLLETLPPTATKEMITSGFDLSLYTCTPGGGSRVTVRCSKT